MGLAIDQDSARAALTFAAAILAAGEVELFAKDGKEGGIGFGIDMECLIVDKKVDGGSHRSASNKKRVRRCRRMRNPLIQRRRAKNADVLTQKTR
jgi:hypothetical protein